MLEVLMLFVNTIRALFYIFSYHGLQHKVQDFMALLKNRNDNQSDKKGNLKMSPFFFFTILLTK